MEAWELVSAMLSEGLSVLVPSFAGSGAVASRRNVAVHGGAVPGAQVRFVISTCNLVLERT
jgi:hypothetical protein